MSKKENRSKFLSLILRHKPETIGISLDSNGWADVNELITKISLEDKDFNMEVLEDIVKTDSKMRYSFNEDKTKIRANQGHSIKVNVELKSPTPPSILFHGTSNKSLPDIMNSGLKKMSRLYVHLSDNYDTAFKVGKRHSGALPPVVLKIDAARMVADDYKFYISENGVWLIDHVPSKYIIFE